MIKDLPGVHSIRETPNHFTRLEIKRLRLPPVLIFESLPCRLEVDHDPIHIVLVKLCRDAVCLECAQNLRLVVVEPIPPKEP